MCVRSLRLCVIDDARARVASAATGHLNLCERRLFKTNKKFSSSLPLVACSCAFVKSQVAREFQLLKGREKNHIHRHKVKCLKCFRFDSIGSFCCQATIDNFQFYQSKKSNKNIHARGQLSSLTSIVVKKDKCLLLSFCRRRGYRELEFQFSGNGGSSSKSISRFAAACARRHTFSLLFGLAAAATSIF